MMINRIMTDLTLGSQVTLESHVTLNIQIIDDLSVPFFFAMMMLPFLTASCVLPGPADSGASHTHCRVKTDKLKKKGKNRQTVESESGGQHDDAQAQATKPMMQFKLNTLDIEVGNKFCRCSHLTMPDFASFAEFRRWGRNMQSQCVICLKVSVKRCFLLKDCDNMSCPLQV